MDHRDVALAPGQMTGQSGFNSCIEATKTYLIGKLKSLPPSTLTNESFVARPSPRNESWRLCGPSSRFERLGGCGFGTWTNDRFQQELIL